tara:strand:- start:14049 stop:14219 length:171 start_codon:yes stop_codon:yes gene_type:complete
MINIMTHYRNINIKMSKKELDIIQDLIAQRIGEDKVHNVHDEELFELMRSLDSQTM